MSALPVVAQNRLRIVQHTNCADLIDALSGEVVGYCHQTSAGWTAWTVRRPFAQRLRHHSLSGALGEAQRELEQ